LRSRGDLCGTLFSERLGIEVVLVLGFRFSFLTEIGEIRCSEGSSSVWWAGGQGGLVFPSEEVRLVL
jgi:hypothetical protein